MFCPNCGFSNEDNSVFCSNCGAPLSNSGAQASAGSAANGQGYQTPPNGQAYQTPPPYGQAYQTPPSGNMRAPIPKRNIAVCILLSIVTCGIYGIYWFICLVNELNTADNTPGDTSGGMVFLFTLLTCGIYGIYWFYKAGQKVESIRRKQGYGGDGNTGILYLILSLLGLAIVNYCLIQSELNNVSTMQ